MDLEVDYKEDSESRYNSFFKQMNFPACGFLNGTDKSNPYMNILQDLIDKNPDPQIHACPYSVSFSMYQSNEFLMS